MKVLARIALAVCLACLLGWSDCNKKLIKPYNLVISSDGADQNGLLLNPLWGSQAAGNGPPTPLGSPDEPWSPSQTDWDIGHDSGGIPGFCVDGHRNWVDVGGPDRLRVGTYTGFLTWESHSAPWPINDDDYSFNLVPGNVAGNLSSAGLQKNEDHIHVEYNVSEVGNQFDDWDGDSYDGETPWWKAFHNAVDHDDVTPTPANMLSSRYAVVTGLLGMDTAHTPPKSDNGGETEIHPTWAMAVRVKDDPTDETYAFMARNWGDEGYCADGTQLTLNRNYISILLPWRPGARSLDGWSGEFSIVNAPDSNLPNNVMVTRAGASGLLLTFKLQQQPQDEPDEDGTVTEGEIHLQWTVGGVNQPPVLAPPTAARASDRGGDVESGMQVLLEKMNPKQRSAFSSKLRDRLPRKHSSLSAIQGPAHAGSLPDRMEKVSAPEFGRVRSKRRARREQARMAALHAIFGATMPGSGERAK